MGTDVKNNCKGCEKCQLNKYSRVKPLGDPQPLELPTRRWGSVSMDFVTHFPTTESSFDCITTYVGRYLIIVHLVPSKGTDSATNVAEGLFHNIFRLHRMTD